MSGILLMLAGASVAGGPFLFSWGSNGGVGKLGLNDIVNRSSPTQVGTTNNWAQVSAGATHSAVVTPNGEIYAWGNNNVGVLGLNDTNNRSSPVQVGSLTNWSQVSAGQNMCVAVKTDGTLWSWGYKISPSGVLGLNDDVSRSSPTQVGGLANWAQVSAGAGGNCSAIKTGGTLWTWGVNGQGQLGLNDIVNRSSPTQVGGSTNWSKVSTGGGGNCAAIKTDGTLWSWGRGSNGYLGLNDTVYRSSPVQVGSLTTWSQVAAGGGHCLVIKTDGTLWSWGLGTFGRLGLSDTNNRSSPVQVGSLTNWSQVAAGGERCTAIKTDGTLWAWGKNDYGQLGLGDVDSRSSPVQVGALINWSQVSAGGTHCLAILD